MWKFVNTCRNSIGQPEKCFFNKKKKEKGKEGHMSLLCFLFYEWTNKLDGTLARYVQVWSVWGPWMKTWRAFELKNGEDEIVDLSDP
jgi:hypothetical protein